MKSPTWVSIIASACATAACRISRPSRASRPRSSTVYRNTSSSFSTSASTSRGTARSMIRIGRRLRVRSALSISPLPMIGNVLAVQVTMMSCAASCEGSSVKVMVRPRKRSASACARSSVRLAKVACFGCCAEKCVAHNSIISPAPMKSTL